MNTVRDTIITAFEVTRATNNKVPMLLLSNPGLAKTSIIKEIAEHENMRVVSIIGSAFDNSEILGFQVNEPGKDFLITKNPTWYQKILDNKEEGFSSILFIDEISVCPSIVQGALYRLIFERTIGNGKNLPDDCVIISAGNYKANLPSYCEITSPALNRFCIINLESPTPEEFLEEFSQTEKERINNWPSFNKENKIVDAEKKAATEIKNMMKEVFEIYSDSGSAKGALDLNNKDFASMFDGDYSQNGKVYNFISGRTYYYLQLVAAACANLGVPLNTQKNRFIAKAVEGLIGLGTGTFCDSAQLSNYLKTVVEKTKICIKNIKNNYTGDRKNVDVLDGAQSISDKVNNLSMFIDGLSFNMVDAYKAIGNIYEQVKEKYENVNAHEFLLSNFGTSPYTVTEAEAEERKLKYSELVADITSIDNCIKIIADLKLDKPDINLVVNSFTKIVENFKFYTSMVI